MLAFYLALVDNLSDKEKVEKIYTEYYGLMMHIALGYTQDGAEDIVHDAMIRIIKNIDKVDISNERRTKAFCVTIVRNRAIDCLRKENKDTVSYDDEIWTENKNVFSLDFAQINETYDILMKALDSLNETYKTVCTLKYVNELKEHEIAEVLDLPPKTVSLRIFRGKQILREALRKEDFYAR